MGNDPHPTVSRRGLLASAALVAAAAPAWGQAAWPTRPIRMIVPGTGGGGMDVIARVIADRVSALLGQPIVVENRAGAGGNIAVDAVAKAAPDGYTMLLGQTAHFAINPSLYARLPFDPIRDFIPVILLADAPNVVVVGATSPYHTLAQVVAAAKAAPDGLDLATPGNGTVSHLTGELFQQVAGIRFTHVPYRGAAAAVTDVIAGRVPVMMSSVPTALSHIREGLLRAVAVSAAKRSPVLPDVPTIGQAGYPGFDANTWYGFFLPAGTPAPIVQRLNAAANEALRAPGVADRVRQEGGDIVGGTPAAFAELVAADLAKWSRVVRESGARAE
ncbi:tripartite tricarboxylate transporter substrate binding protein [Humitalea sp. 24SJ18S-53]|uniref:tripartite tricarboxylate transporter substrate binding protein n=1 Tax=Humitalea sp. 24SJ18S-53 TaxID=3422307 RepID=UPI003D66578E